MAEAAAVANGCLHSNDVLSLIVYDQQHERT